MIHINKEEFLANLRLTQVYCEQQLKHNEEKPIAVLRSLNPNYGEGKLFRYVANEYPASYGAVPEVVEWAPGADPYDSVFMASIFENQLSIKNASPESICEDSRGGILVIEYDANIADGASAIESKGFVDTIDFPPIDTWFYRAYHSTYRWLLFTWVPEAFMSSANEAAAVHFLDIIHWFEEWLPAEYYSIMRRWSRAE